MVHKKTTVKNIVIILALAAALSTAYGHVAAGTDALQRASGTAPAAKTEQTVKAEKELEKLKTKEKQIKDNITAATINRSRLLAQKRADLKQARQKREEPVKKEVTDLKAKKTKQTALIKETKSKLAAAKKEKKTITVTTLEASLKTAEKTLADINAKLTAANAKLAKSYTNYKALYDQFTRTDAGIKKILDINKETEAKIKAQKEDLKNTKSEYDQYIKNKDFLSAERRMNSLVFIQTGINDNYSNILEIKQKVKSDYYAQIVNYKI